MSKADLQLEYWQRTQGFPYGLGWVSSPTGLPDPKYDAPWEAHVPAKLGDCSGNVWGGWVYSGATINGRVLTRDTANDYWHMATVKLAQPEHPGDIGVLLNSGTDYAHHIMAYLGGDMVGEMGDGHGIAAIHTVAHENARGVKWGRIPGLDLGELTPQTPEVDMTADEYRALIDTITHADKSAKQNGYKLAALGRALVGDYAGAVQLEKDFQATWHGERGMFPPGMTAEQMKAAVQK